MAADPLFDVAKRTLRLGEEYPYDAPDFWSDNPVGSPPASDWAVAAARGVIADLSDRRGIKQGFYDIDQELRSEIVGALAAIIRAAKEQDDAR